MSTTKVTGRVRFEPPQKRDGTPHPYGFGLRCVCDHCGTPLRVLHAEIHLDHEDYPTATLTVTAADVDRLVAFLEEAGVKPAADRPPFAHAVNLYDSTSAPFPADVAHATCRVPSHAPECECQTVTP